MCDPLSILFLCALFMFLIWANSRLIFGVNEATSFEYNTDDNPELGIVPGSEMILYKIRKWSLEYLGKFWSKPLFTCPTCMASVHSIYVYWPVTILLFGFHVELIYFYVVYVLALAGHVSKMNNDN